MVWNIFIFKSKYLIKSELAKLEFGWIEDAFLDSLLQSKYITF